MYHTLGFHRRTLFFLVDVIFVERNLGLYLWSICILLQNQFLRFSSLLLKLFSISILNHLEPERIPGNQIRRIRWVWKQLQFYSFSAFLLICETMHCFDKSVIFFFLKWAQIARFNFFLLNQIKENFLIGIPNTYRLQLWQQTVGTFYTFDVVHGVQCMWINVDLMPESN